MSFERNRFGFDGEITFSCDSCGEEEHTDTASFPDALAHIKSYGWIAKRDADGDWCHYCSGACVK